MRTFAQLNRQDRELAVLRSEVILVDSIVECFVEFKMPNRLHELDMQNILTNARKQDLGLIETKNLLMKHPQIRVELKKLALVIAEGSKWDDNIQPIMEA